MPYSNFTLKKVKEAFHLEVVEDQDLFSAIEAVAVSEYLQVTLDYNVPLAVAIGTEKARSELIISNVLLELKKYLHGTISFFSGISFDVDREQDLIGFCDYVVSMSPEQFYLNAPIVAIIEAKNEQIPAGLGQCIAAMVAARLFNQAEGNTLSCLYGAVTTGNIWKFLKYDATRAYIDRREYHITDVQKILGILVAMVHQSA